jgi:hypothetical protein
MVKDQFIKENRSITFELIREVRNSMFDSQFEIVSIINKESAKVKKINEERKKAASY